MLRIVLLSWWPLMWPGCPEHFIKPPDPPPPKPESTVVSGPILHCDEPVHDFGTVWTGPDLQHEFTVKNIGSETGWVNYAASGGGLRCRFGICPGEAIQISVTLATTRLRNRFEKGITLKLLDVGDDTCLHCMRCYQTAEHLSRCGPYSTSDYPDSYPWCIRRQVE